MIRPLFNILCLLAAAVAWPGTARAADPIAPIAQDYVRLSLAAGEREPGYVDAYIGPKSWTEEAKRDRRTPAELSVEAARLAARLRAVNPARLDPLSRRRRSSLLLQLRAAEIRMAMRAGRKFSFDEEAEGLFGIRPHLKPLASYDETLSQIDRLVPGPGPLWQRMDAYQKRFAVPADKVAAVVGAAIEECRRRTLPHIALPAGETIRLELVRDKPWGGYNYYQGSAASLIQINVDLPLPIERAVDLGCHEGYPGHHVLYTLVEERLAKRRGWIEYSIYPLYSPMSLIAEGSANYGPTLAFPGNEQAGFQAETLFPLAGLDPTEAGRYDALVKALAELKGANQTIARDYLDGRIDRDRAIALTQHYQLVSPERAAQSLSFVDTYRTYVLNYGLGRDMVAAKIERSGTDANSRWAEFERLISEPITPDDLLKTTEAATD